MGIETSNQDEIIKVEDTQKKESTEYVEEFPDSERIQAENAAKINAECEKLQAQINEYQNLVNTITNDKEKQEIQKIIDSAKDLLTNDDIITNEIITQVNNMLNSVKDDYFDIIKILKPNVEATNQEIEGRSKYLMKGKNINKEDYKLILGEERYNYLIGNNVDIKTLEKKADKELKEKTEEEKVLIINEISKNSDTRTLCRLSKYLLGAENTGMCTIGENPSTDLCCVKYQKGYILFYKGYSYYGNLPEEAITMFIIGNINNPGISFSTKTKGSNESEIVVGDSGDVSEKISKTGKTNVDIENLPIRISMYMKTKITEKGVEEDKIQANKFGIGVNVGHELNLNENISLGIGGGVYKGIEQKYSINKKRKEQGPEKRLEKQIEKGILEEGLQEGLREIRQKGQEGQTILKQNGGNNTSRDYNVSGTISINNINTYFTTMYRKDSDGKAISLTGGYEGKKEYIDITGERNFDDRALNIYGEYNRKIKYGSIGAFVDWTVGDGSPTIGASVKINLGKK